MGEGKQKKVPGGIGASRFWEAFLIILMSKTAFEIDVFLKKIMEGTFGNFGGFGRSFWRPCWRYYINDNLDLYIIYEVRT